MIAVEDKEWHIDFNHKGLFCEYIKSQFCQEGYCRGCWVMKKWDSILKEIIGKTE